VTRLCTGDSPDFGTCQVLPRKRPKRRPYTDLHLPSFPQKTHQTKTLHKFAPARFSPENTPNEDPTQICTCQVSHRKHPKRRPYTNLHLPRFPLKTRQTKTLHKFAPARFSQENTPNENPTQICTSTQNTPNEDPTQICTCQVLTRKRPKRKPSLSPSSHPPKLPFLLLSRLSRPGRKVR
jgi:hypothetical protein